MTLQAASAPLPSTRPNWEPTLVQPAPARRDGGPQPDPDAIRRLVVLVPGPAADLAALATQVQTLARPRALPVLLVGQGETLQDVWAARRQLTTLAALIAAHAARPVDTLVSPPRPWLKLLREVQQAGDLVVCHAEQSQTTWPWSRRQSLGEQLRRQLNVPTCVLQGHFPGLRTTTQRMVSQGVSWAIPMAVILGFLLLQVQVELHTTGWLTAVLLSASVLIELAILAR
ncbi:MAG TPA: hypothetical protein PLC98_22870 [Anaerolineales bacterium]|nr:hypothetical protein [Anaerolineales bacterium]